jgi:hypothetical protein
MTAIVANEQEALEMIRRMARSTDEHPLIKDIFGTEVDIETLESRLNNSGRCPL